MLVFFEDKLTKRRRLTVVPCSIHSIKIESPYCWHSTALARRWAVVWLLTVFLVRCHRVTAVMAPVATSTGLSCFWALYEWRHTQPLLSASGNTGQEQDFFYNVITWKRVKVSYPFINHLVVVFMKKCSSNLSKCMLFSFIELHNTFSLVWSQHKPLTFSRKKTSTIWQYQMQLIY